MSIKKRRKEETDREREREREQEREREKKETRRHTGNPLEEMLNSVKSSFSQFWFLCLMVQHPLRVI